MTSLPLILDKKHYYDSTVTLYKRGLRESEISTILGISIYAIKQFLLAYRDENGLTDYQLKKQSRDNRVYLVSTLIDDGIKKYGYQRFAAEWGVMPFNFPKWRGGVHTPVGATFFALLKLMGREDILDI